MPTKNFTIDVTEFNQWTRDFPEALRAGGEAGIQESILALENAVKSNIQQGETGIRGRVASGVLLGAVFSEMRGTLAAGLIRGVVAVSPPADRYALVIESGRTPGARMPPSEALIPWVIQKLGNAIKITASIRAGKRGRGRRRIVPRDRESAARGLAFVIARSIGRKGFAGIHMFGRAFEQFKDAIPALVHERIQEAITRIRK